MEVLRENCFSVIMVLLYLCWSGSASQHTSYVGTNHCLACDLVRGLGIKQRVQLKTKLQNYSFSVTFSFEKQVLQKFSKNPIFSRVKWNDKIPWQSVGPLWAGAAGAAPGAAVRPGRLQPTQQCGISPVPTLQRQPAIWPPRSPLLATSQLLRQPSKVL